MEKIKVGIVGHGNLGRGVERSLMQQPDMELAAIFTRRDPATISPETKDASVRNMNQVVDYKGQIDVMILCGGSAADLPIQSPAMATHFNIIDSFDTHAKIPEHYDKVDGEAQKGGTLGIISVGWDPGLFSLNRLYGEAILPQGETYTFWGPGLSQGHSDAIRRIPGVTAGVQYTVPIEDAVDAARAGNGTHLTTRQKHRRECYVVIEAGADQGLIETTIKEMPDYFADYDTTVTFITQEELERDHCKMPHGGFVIRSGETGEEGHKQVIEYGLMLDSNPEFTAAALVCYARAAYLMNKEGETGARTVFDVAPAYLSSKTNAQLRAEML